MSADPSAPIPVGDGGSKGADREHLEPAPDPAEPGDERARGADVDGDTLKAAAAAFSVIPLSIALTSA